MRGVLKVNVLVCNHPMEKTDLVLSKFDAISWVFSRIESIESFLPCCKYRPSVNSVCIFILKKVWNICLLLLVCIWICELIN